MSGAYSNFLKEFTDYNERVKVKIVTSGSALRIVFLIELFFLKLIFLVVSLPFFLFSSPQKLTSRSLKDSSSVHQVFQKVIVLSFFGVFILVFAFMSILSPLTAPVQIHGASSFPLQFSGSRPYQENISPSIDQMNISPFDHSLNLSGTGPAYASVEIFVDNGASFIGTAQVNGQGQWQYFQNPQDGLLSSGPHSVFVAFFGNDHALLGNPTAMKMFEVPAGNIAAIFHYFNFISLTIAVFCLAIFVFAVVQLKKTVKIAV